MTTFTYTVTVEVEDDAGMPIECYDERWFPFTDDVEDEGGEIVARFLSPAAMAEIVMLERLNYDENYGFKYSISWEASA